MMSKLKKMDGITHQQDLNGGKIKDFLFPPYLLEFYIF